MPGGLSVLIVPGIFGDCVDDQSLPFSDGIERERPANYTGGYAHYRASLGSVRAIQLSGRASPASNAVLIAGEVQSDHWTYVLPLSGHPRLLVRTITSPADFPRAACFRAVVKSVAQDLQR